MSARQKARIFSRAKRDSDQTASRGGHIRQKANWPRELLACLDKVRGVTCPVGAFFPRREQAHPLAAQSGRCFDTMLERLVRSIWAIPPPKMLHTQHVQPTQRVFDRVLQSWIRQKTRPRELVKNAKPVPHPLLPPPKHGPEGTLSLAVTFDAILRTGISMWLRYRHRTPLHSTHLQPSTTRALLS